VGKLRENFVDKTHGGGQAIVVDVLCKESANVAWSRAWSAVMGRGQRWDSPRPPTMRTEGLPEVPSVAAIVESDLSGVQEVEPPSKRNQMGRVCCL
jgi:hypothetical protein